MFIYLVRHAWAGHAGDPGWANDSLRELTPDGKIRFAQVVCALADRGFEPARIATSPYARCRQTAEIVAEHVPGCPKVDELDALAPGSDLEDLLAWTHAQDGRDVAWVGHNPDLPVLASMLLGDRGANVRFAKGAVAALKFDGPIEPEAAELYWLATAKLLGV